MEVQFQTATTKYHLDQILALQAANLRSLHSPETEKEEGFVTVRHSYELLSKMNTQLPHAIALTNEQLVGYALAMPSVFRNSVMDLQPMFSVLDTLSWEGKPFKEYNYLVMGQVCIANDWRRKGVFRQLYVYYFSLYRSRFDCIVTEVALRNQRSLQAHLAVGFVPVHTYLEEGVEEWTVLVY